MNIKSLFIVLACTAILIPAKAQDNTTVGLQLPVIEQPENPGNIVSIEVISNIGDSAFIGVLPSTSPNVRTNVVIEQGIQAWLQDYIAQQFEFGNSFQANGKKLSWVIKELRIGKDSSANGSTAFTKLTADVYNKETGHYQTKSTVNYYESNKK